MNKSGCPPKSSTPYRILGEIPWGGRDERRVLGGKTIPPDARPTILRECVKLMQTAEAAANARPGARLTEVRSSSIDPFDLEQGIRELGGSYATNEWISPLDVMLYTCRVVDRLLVEVGIRTEPRTGGYPTNAAKMRECVRQVASEVYRIASAEGITTRLLDRA